MLAAAHLHPGLTVPPVIIVLAALAWYWFRLARPGVPRSRRTIRRLSLLAMALALPPLVRALSFVDPRLSPREYVIVWTVAMFLLLVVIATALLDAMNTLRMHQAQRHEALQQTAVDLAIDLHRRRSAAASSPSHRPAAGRAKDESP